MFVCTLFCTQSRLSVRQTITSVRESICVCRSVISATAKTIAAIGATRNPASAVSGHQNRSNRLNSLCIITLQSLDDHSNAECRL